MATSRIPEGERFWGKVQKSDGCWQWTGHQSQDGYGQFKECIDGVAKSVRAHRKAWELTNGAIPDGLLVLHHCDNRLCVRVDDHLFLGTNDDNMADLARKGRAARGVRNVNAKLTEESVREIRALLSRGAKSPDVASRFGVSNGTIWFIAKGVTWRHVDGVV